VLTFLCADYRPTVVKKASLPSSADRMIADDVRPSAVSNTEPARTMRRTFSSSNSSGTGNTGDVVDADFTAPIGIVV